MIMRNRERRQLHTLNISRREFHVLIKTILVLFLLLSQIYWLLLFLPSSGNYNKLFSFIPDELIFYFSLITCILVPHFIP